MNYIKDKAKKVGRAFTTSKMRCQAVINIENVAISSTKKMAHVVARLKRNDQTVIELQP